MAEEFPTLVTLKWLFSSVNRLVFDERQILQKHLPTILALRSSFCSMNFLMLEKVFVKVKGGLAFGTFVAFPSVGLLMLNETKGTAETLTTVITLVGFGNCVGFLPLDRPRAGTWQMATVSTLPWFSSSVNFPMPQEVCILAKSFPTLATNVGFVSRRIHKKARTLVESALLFLIHSGLLPHMNDPVLDEMAAPAEALPTFATLVCLVARLIPTFLRLSWRQALFGKITDHGLLSHRKEGLGAEATLEFMTLALCGTFHVGDNVRTQKTFWIF